MINDILLFTYTLSYILLVFITLFVLVTLLAQVVATYSAYSFLFIGTGLIYLGVRSS